MESKEQCEKFCEMFEQIINTDDTFLNNKTKLYCEYVLSLGKEYINGKIRPGLYEECKRFIEMEEYEKDLKFGIEAIEICKEILFYIEETDQMLEEKAKAYCKYFLSHKLDGVECSKLKERCRKYLKDFHNFYKYKSDYEEIKFERKERERLLNM